MDLEADDEETIYRAIMDRLETQIGDQARNITIEIEDDEVTIEGAVPSQRIDDELQHILYDTLELDAISYEVIVDEDLQVNRNESYGDDQETDGRLDGVDHTLEQDLSQSPRQQF